MIEFSGECCCTIVLLLLFTSLTAFGSVHLVGIYNVDYVPTECKVTSVTGPRKGDKTKSYWDYEVTTSLATNSVYPVAVLRSGSMLGKVQAGQLLTPCYARMDAAGQVQDVTTKSSGDDLKTYWPLTLINLCCLLCTCFFVGNTLLARRNVDGEYCSSSDEESNDIYLSRSSKA